MRQVARVGKLVDHPGHIIAECLHGFQRAHVVLLPDKRLSSRNALWLLGNCSTAASCRDPDGKCLGSITGWLRGHQVRTCLCYSGLVSTGRTLLFYARFESSQSAKRSPSSLDLTRQNYAIMGCNKRKSSQDQVSSTFRESTTTGSVLKSHHLLTGAATVAKYNSTLCVDFCRGKSEVTQGDLCS